MKLHSLVNVHGSVKKSKRVGCGEGGGHGKTSGRGGKGQTARSGGSIRPGFEGGQMPLYRKLPHRGFSNFRFRLSFAAVNLDDLETLPSDVTEVGPEQLFAAGLIRSKVMPVKILARGTLTRTLVVAASKYSVSARAKIESLGGKALVV